MTIPDIIQLVKGISWAGAAVVIVFAIKPFMPTILSKFTTKNGENKGGDTLAKQVQALQEQQVKLETNHMAHLEESLRSAWKAINAIQTEQTVQGKAIARIEGKINP